MSLPSAIATAVADSQTEAPTNNNAPPLLQEAQENLSTLATYINYIKQAFSWGKYIANLVNTLLTF